MNFKHYIHQTKIKALLIIALTIGAFSANASHLAGGNFIYSCAGPNSYTIQLSLLLDCDGNVGLQNNLQIELTSPCGNSITRTLTRNSNLISNISQICDAEMNNTSCDGGPYPGLEEHIYESNINLPYQCDSWTLSYSVIYRNNSNNLQNPTTTDFEVNATLNNADADCPDNNSPQFNYTGIPFVCVGQEFQFNPGVTDPDDDSLVYSLVTPASANWGAGYSAAQPFGPNTPVTFNSHTGQLTFTPDADMTVGDARWSIAIQVCKYRDGELLGCATRDFQFIAQNCNNSTPYMEDPGIVNLSQGATLVDSNSVEVCGEDITDFSFDIFFADSLVSGQLAGDSITITTNIQNAFPNATVVINNGNPASINFSHNSPIGAPLFRNFVVQLEDDACPVPAVATYQFDVTVLPTVEPNILFDVHCSDPDSTFVTVTGSDHFNWSVISGDPIALGVNFTDTNATGVTNNVWMSPSQSTIYEVNDGSSGAICKNSDTVTILKSEEPDNLLPNDTVICDGDSLEIGTNDTIEFVDFAWNTGDTTGTIYGFPGNVYQLTVTDTNGCQYADTVEFFNNPFPQVDIGDFDTLCTGQSLTYDAGDFYETYLWSDNSTEDTLTVNSSGTYYIEVTDSNGCVSSDTANIHFSPGPAIDLGNDTALCVEDDITLDAGAGSAPYLWSTGETTQSITASNDTFWVEATDSVGCVNADTIVINEIPKDTNLLGADTSICVVDSIELGTNVATHLASYSWNTGDSNRTIFGYPGNTYQITVTDTNGCESADTIVINSLPDPNHDLGNDTAICFNENITFSPGANFDTYNWSTSETTDNITVNTAGQYSVTTTDTFGCTYIDTVDLTIYNEIPINPNITDTLICVYDSVLIDITTPGYNEYYWVTQNDSSSTIYLSEGEHPYEAVDTNGCTNGGNIQITSPSLPGVVPSTGQVCPGDSSTITANSAYESYSWFNGDTNQTTKVLGPDTYTVTATDALGCEYEGSILAVSYPVDSVDLGGSDSLCAGETKLLNAGGNYADYVWDDSTSNPVRVVDSTADYYIEVTDSNGCRSFDTAFIYFSDGPDIDLGNDTALCPEDDIRLEAGENLAPYTWSTSETTESIFASSGTFWVEATDSLGCPNTDTIVLTDRVSPDPDIDTNIHYCEETTFDQVLNPGPGFEDYLWHNGATSQVITVTEEDSTVWVTVHDQWGCIGSDTIEVIEDPMPDVDLGGGDTICAGQTKSLNAGTSGGVIVSYLWSYNNATTQTVNITSNSGQENVSNVNHSVTVTDHNGCQNTDTFNLVTMPLPTPDLGNDTAYCIGDAFSLTLDPGNFVSYNWNTSSSDPTITVGAVDANYSVQVTDTNGCTASDNINVVENSLPQPTLPADTNICEGISFNFVLRPGGFAEYDWSTGSTNSSILVNSGGTYEVTVTDVNGCENDTQMTVIIDPSPDPDLGNDIVVCEDSVFLFTLDANPTMAGPNYIFDWSTGASSDTLDVTDIGEYSVTVTDPGNGCSDSSQMAVIGFDKLDPDLGSNDVICDGEAKILDPVANADGYSFTWSTGESTRRILINQPGTYWVELNAVNGTCAGITDTVHFKQGTMPVLDLGPDIRVCQGEIVQLLDDHSTFPNTDYIWQDTIETVRYQVTETGTYRVQATNECGTSTDEIHVMFDDCNTLYIPNAFTPNGDGINDVFKPETDQPVREYSLVIYNRWGRAVFKTNDINVGWDGTRNGGALPQDVYIYKVSYVSGLDPRRKRREQVGNVTLIKGEAQDF